jgi:hypothetical protein
MAVYQFNVVFNGKSGLAEDKFVNTWHFSNSSATTTDFDNVRDMLKDFYDTADVGSPVRTYLSADLLALTVNVTAYNLDDEKPRAPAYESTWGPETFGSGSPLPSEVALCMSYEGPRESGSPQARRRNRIYLGPFKGGVINDGGRPSVTMTTDIMRAGSRLHSASDASATWDWCAYSGTDNDWWEIAHVWVDNAWDTQRRRGLQPTSRSEIRYT